MRQPARPLPVLALLPVLLFGVTACQSAAERGALAPAAGPAVLVDDGAPGGKAPGRPGAKDARVGGTARLHGSQFGRHLQVALGAFVDPAISVDKNFAPPAGKRWVAASMSFVNVGVPRTGRSDACGRTTARGGVIRW